MATNFYFNNFKNSGEQDLLESLVVEAIQVYGLDMYYITRDINHLDKLYTADDQSSYTKPYLCEFYIKSVDGFGGDGNFMSKFGLEIRDQVVFSVAQRTFSKEIGAYTTLIRPNEGDLIYFPLNNKCFQVKFVNKFEMFFQLGALQTWEMTCELFEYSNEVFSTGIDAIDSIQVNRSTNILDYVIEDEQNNLITDENGNYLVVESYDLDKITGTGTNQDFSAEASGFVDFSRTDPFSEGAI
jgi:hypothetical protein